MHLAKDVVAGKDDTFFLHDHGGLVGRVAGHVDQAEGVVAHVELHLASEGDHRGVGPIALQQLRLLRPERRDPGDVRGHISGQDPGSHALVSDHRDVEVRVPRPVVAVGLGVQDVAEPAAAFDVRFESDGVTGLVWAVDHHDSVGRCDDPVIAPAELGLDEDVGRQLLHGVPRSSGRSRATGYGIVGLSARPSTTTFSSSGSPASRRDLSHAL